MKILVLLFLFACLSASAQEIPKKYAAVKKEVDRINSDSSLMKVELENEEFLEQTTDGGGSLTGFFNEKEIQKITRVVFLSAGKETRDYYWIRGRLGFVYVTSERFNVERDTIDYSRPTTRDYTGKFYFSNDRVIDAEVSGDNFFVPDDARIGPTLVSEAEEYKKKLHDKFVLGE